MENEPVTRADLKALESRLEGKLDASEQHILDRVGELVRDSETRLLQAFYGFAEATNERFNQIDGNVGMFLNRLGTIETRVLERETRLNVPPVV